MSVALEGGKKYQFPVEGGGGMRRVLWFPGYKKRPLWEVVLHNMKSVSLLAGLHRTGRAGLRRWAAPGLRSTRYREPHNNNKNYFCYNSDIDDNKCN
jgi:hypothetical protein